MLLCVYSVLFSLLQSSHLLMSVSVLSSPIFTPGMNLLNGTHGSKDKDAGEKRWNLHTTSFITGTAYSCCSLQSRFLLFAKYRLVLLKHHDLSLSSTTYATGNREQYLSGAAPFEFNPWSPENMMGMHNGLPHLPEKVFYTEAKSWIATGKYKPHWPGMMGVGNCNLCWFCGMG